MDHLEMVEKLREKANVSYEEASAALEKCNWDLLDALLMLEGQGKIDDHAQRSSEYTTRESTVDNRTRKEHEPGLIARLLHAAGEVIKKCNAVNVQVKKHGEVRITLPLTVVILIVVFMFWWVIAAAAIAMLFGYRYSVQGLSIDSTVNSAMDKAGDFVDNVVKPDVRVVHGSEDAKNNDASIDGTDNGSVQ